MAYVDTIRLYEQNPQGLEKVYQQARRNGQAHEFAQAVEQLHAAAPDQLLLQAWFYRLTQEGEGSRVKGSPNWLVAIVLSLLCGLSIWLLADPTRFTIGDEIPIFVFVVAPLCALWIMGYITITAPPDRAPARYWLVLLGLLLAGAVTYVVYVGPRMQATTNQESYLLLAALHLVLLAWAAVGRWLLWGKPTASDHFAFLLKSFETVVVGGLFVLAGGVFTGLSFGLFDTLGFTVEDWMIRLFLAGGGGLIPVLAVALTYDPKRAPGEQNFQEGISRLIATLMRLMLPLALLLLVVYIGLIPMNFYQPFQNREVLIVYNLLLFAVIGLLVSATPVWGQPLPTALGQWLRRGLLTLAGLAVLISLYALAAIVYRTGNDGFTPNRVTIIGWNLLNIVLLLLLLVRQLRSKAENWLPTMYETFAQGAKAYLVWSVVVLLVIPWLFMWVQEPINFWAR